MIHSTVQDALETLAAMRHQEDSGYATRDFLHQQEQADVVPHAALHDAIDVDCRNKMCEWCYQIVEFCKLGGDAVEIAMSYLDRFLLTKVGAAALHDRNLYQLASMTTLYTAIKVHESQALSPSAVSQLSRGAYTTEQIEQMEATILSALEWRMNPPTALSFVREFLKLIPEDSLSKQACETALETTKFQTELSVSDYKLIATPKSTIAYCSLMNALESTGVVDKTVLSHIGFILAQSIGLNSSIVLLSRSPRARCRAES